MKEYIQYSVLLLILILISIVSINIYQIDTSKEDLKIELETKEQWEESKPVINY